MKRLVSFVLIALVAGVAVRGQHSAQETLGALKPAPGLELKLWAAEPMLTNPTDITVDERGRVWVLEGVNYRRTQRNLPDPRPAGDRIVILEDSDQDGQADKVKVFDQNPQIRVPLGIAVLGDKVYVSQAPDLIVYTKDADRYLPDLQTLAGNGPIPVRVAAIRAIGALGVQNVEPWAQEIVLGDLPNEVRVEAMRLLGGSVAGLTAILDLAEKGSIPPELHALARNLTNYASPPSRGGRRGAPQSPVAMRAGRGGAPTDPAYIAVRERAAKSLPMPSAKRIPSAFELDLSYAGKAAEGRTVFETGGGCVACHSLGGRKTLGPDLSAIGRKYGKQAMLDSIIAQSDAIGPEYVTTMFTLKSGDPVQGLVTEESADRIVVQTAPDQYQRLRPSDVVSRRENRVSLMPEGLLDNLPLQQIADLLEYLATLK
jgi:putative heme-binding domain-containing protein